MSSRAVLFIVICVCAVVPNLAFAAWTPCPPGQVCSYEDGSPKCSFDEAKSLKFADKKPNEVGVSLKSDNDDCVHETAEIDIKGGAYIVTPTGSTRPQGPKACETRNNCATGEQKCGIVTYGIGGSKCKINKCDKDFEENVEKCLGSQDLAEELQKLERELQEEEIRQTGELPDGLLDAFSPETKKQIEEALSKDRDAVAKEIGGLLYGDDAEKQAIASKYKITSSQLDYLAKNARSLTTPEAIEGYRKSLQEFGRQLVGKSVTGFDSLIGQGQQSLSDAIEKSRQAISQIESGSPNGNYFAQGPLTRYGRCLGRYQVCPVNIPQWTREALGRSLSASEFLNCPSCQDKVFEYKFGQYIKQFGSPENAAKAWFAGPGYAKKSLSTSDGGSTIAQYAAKFSNLYSGAAVPFGGIASAYTGGSGSPFGNISNFLGNGVTPRPVSPLTAAIPVGQPMNVGTPNAVGAQQAPSQAYQTQSQSSNISQSNTLLVNNQPAQQATVVEAIASLLIQPPQPERGSSFTVSWTSVGTSQSAPCKLFLNVPELEGATQVAEGNEGTKSYFIESVAQSGTWRFTLRCSARDGKAFEQVREIAVQ